MNDQNVSLAAPTTPGPVSSLTGWLHARRWFLLVVGIPILVSTGYYGLFASDQYMSQSRFTIKSPSQKQSQMSTLANLIQTTGLSSGQEQTNEVLDYLRSRNALTDLQKRMNVRAAFGMPGIDILSRYPAPFKEDRFENLFKYYSSKVETRLDNDSGLAILEVRAFTPGDARAINAELLRLSETLVNRLNDRSRFKAIAEGERRVAEAEMRMRRARAALGVFRNTTELIDPAKQATGVFEVSNNLIAEQAGLQAQLDLMQRVTPRNPNIPSLRGRVAAIGIAIAAQNARAVGGSGAIASNLGSFENLSLEQEFASQMLTAANASLEQSRSEAQKQQFYLERVVEPDTPDLALYPNRLIKILTIAAAALGLYLIGWMLVVGILEHSPEN